MLAPQFHKWGGSRHPSSPREEPCQLRFGLTSLPFARRPDLAGWVATGESYLGKVAPESLVTDGEMLQMAWCR